MHISSYLSYLFLISISHGVDVFSRRGICMKKIVQGSPNERLWKQKTELGVCFAQNFPGRSDRSGNPGLKRYSSKPCVTQSVSTIPLRRKWDSDNNNSETIFFAPDIDGIEPSHIELTYVRGPKVPSTAPHVKDVVVPKPPTRRAQKKDPAKPITATTSRLFERRKKARLNSDTNDKRLAPRHREINSPRSAARDSSSRSLH